jgi:tetratricopeptide (TPR) repeat protein
MSMRAPTRAIAVAIALLSLAPAASAQPAPTAPPAPADAAHKRSQAKALVDAGLAAHDRGDYDGAIALYTRAYDLVPHPALFFNMGQSHRLAGRADQAIAMYKRYLAAVPTGALADQARTWVAALEQQRASSPDTIHPPSTVPLAGGTSTATTADAAPPPRDRYQLRLAAYGSAGAGGLAIAIGAIYGLRARHFSDELSKPGAPYDPAAFDSGRSAQHKMIGFYAAGGVLVTAGAILYLLARDDEAPRSTTPAAILVPTIDATQIGLTWTRPF